MTIRNYVLQVHFKCIFENLPISLSSFENNILKISHKNTFYFLRYSETIEYVKN